MTRLLKIMGNVRIKDPRFRLSFKVKEDSIQLRDFLSNQDISKKTLTATKYSGGSILVNGIERNVRHQLVRGDLVEIIFPPEKMSAGLVPEDGELDILYEDDTILILNKPPNQSTIPSRNHQSGTLANFIAGKFVRKELASTVHVVTRLDHNTSGLVCIAKNRHIHHLLGKQMISGNFHRQYFAIVEGNIETDQFTINERIGRKDGSIIERVVRDDGQESRTDVQVIGRYHKHGFDLTKISLTLHTGRTHQIRVHMKWAGYPIAGDDLYGGSRKLISRQALHCGMLQFNHPITGERLTFTANFPDDMETLLMRNL